MLSLPSQAHIYISIKQKIPPKGACFDDCGGLDEIEGDGFDAIYGYGDGFDEIYR